MYSVKIQNHCEKLKITRKQFAENAQVSEKTIKRIIDNPEYTPDLKTMQLIAKALGVTVQELFLESDVVLIRKEILDELEESKKFVEECQALAVENLELKDTNIALTKEINNLRSTLHHKNEIISIHESYKLLLDGLARIITETSTDTQ